jgi:hypothetical protein
MYERERERGKNGEGKKTYNPSILQRNHVIDVQIRGEGPLAAVVRRRPRPARRVAVAADDDVGAVPLQHVLARVAGPRDGVPGREQVAVVGAVVGVGGYL